MPYLRSSLQVGVWLHCRVGARRRFVGSSVNKKSLSSCGPPCTVYSWITPPLYNSTATKSTVIFLHALSSYAPPPPQFICHVFPLHLWQHQHSNSLRWLVSVLLVQIQCLKRARTGALTSISPFPEKGRTGGQASFLFCQKWPPWPHLRQNIEKWPIWPVRYPHEHWCR